MRCILCDRCKKIVEDKRKIKVVTYARPLNTGEGVKCPTRADDRQMNDHIWTKEICPACAEEFEDFMEPAVVPEDPPVDPPAEPPEENPDEPKEGSDSGEESGGDDESAE